MDSDFGIIDFDGVDDGAKVGAASLDGAGFEVLAHELDEGGDFLLREPSLGREFREGVFVSLFGDVPFDLGGREVLLEGRVVEVDQPLSDHVEEATQLRLRIAELLLVGCEAARLLVVSRVLAVPQSLEQLGHAAGVEEIPDDGVDDEVVGVRHPDPSAGTRPLAMADTAAAGVVAIAAALAGAHDHSGAAGRAGDEAGQQDRPGHRARGRLLGIPLGKVRLNGVEDFR